MANTKYQESGVTVPVREMPSGKLYMTQHIGEGSFEMGDKTVKFTVASIIPNGSLCVWIGDEDNKPERHYIVQLDDVVQAAMGHYEKEGHKKEDYYGR